MFQLAGRCSDDLKLVGHCPEMACRLCIRLPESLLAQLYSFLSAIFSKICPHHLPGSWRDFKVALLIANAAYLPAVPATLLPIIARAISSTFRSREGLFADVIETVLLHGVLRCSGSGLVLHFAGSSNVAEVRSQLILCP